MLTSCYFNYVSSLQISILNILNNTSEKIVNVEIWEIILPYPIHCSTHVIGDSVSTSFLIAIQMKHNHIVKIYVPELFDSILEYLMTDINDGFSKYNLI